MNCLVWGCRSAAANNSRRLITFTNASFAECEVESNDPFSHDPFSQYSFTAFVFRLAINYGAKGQSRLEIGAKGSRSS